MGHDPERIRRIVEFGAMKRNGNVCPYCGFKRWTGSVHPYAGNRGLTHAQTRWCDGKKTIEAREEPKKYPWGCPACNNITFLTQQEAQVCENLGGCPKCLDSDNEVKMKTDAKVGE